MPKAGGGLVEVFGKGRPGDRCPWPPTRCGWTTAGLLDGNGITQMLERRAEHAGIGKVHPHQFRRTFAHRWLALGDEP
jgi:integrase